MRKGIGVVGCGNIAPIYLTNLGRFPETPVVALADLDGEKARRRADEFGIGRVASVEDLIADPEVDLVLNLTVPHAHGEIALSAVRAGKHVYNEKPLAIEREQGAVLLREAEERGLTVGCAPDTFLGGSHQLCRRSIDQGRIGRPVAAQAFMMCHGHEGWHPSPEFYYEPGGGPLFDMGPYYLTALVNLLGPIAAVAGSAAISFPERTITSEPKRGQVIRVETQTHISGLLEFGNGAIGGLTTSFDVWHHGMPHIEVYGSEGSLRVPDPNGFGGEVWLRRHDDSEWRLVTPADPRFMENSRGLGVLDQVKAIEEHRTPRASGALAMHVLDTMASILESAASGRRVTVSSPTARPEPL
jgi:predicted dehydrogenase